MSPNAKYLLPAFTGIVACVVIVIFTVLMLREAPASAPQETATTTNGTTNPTSARTSSTNASPMTRSPAEQIAENPNGPWSRNLLMATSDDGVTFGATTTVVEAAGVPSASWDAFGNIWLAFQWFPEDHEEAFDRIAVMSSKDGGTTWSDPQPIVIEGLPSTYVRPYDPTLVLTQDEKLRMYFTLGTTYTLDTSFIGSAISEDGIHYVWEEGARMDVPEGGNYDSAAMLFGDTWHLTTPNPASPLGQFFHATSQDGLTFGDPVSLGDAESTQNWTGNMLVDNALLWFYGSSRNNGIWRASTTDGVTWSAPEYTNLNLGDPTIVRRGDDTYLLIAVSWQIR